jgi:hypothetical protein
MEIIVGQHVCSPPNQLHNQHEITIQAKLISLYCHQTMHYCIAALHYKSRSFKDIYHERLRWKWGANKYGDKKT